METVMAQKITYGRLWFWWSSWLAIMIVPRLLDIQCTPVVGKHAMAVSGKWAIHWFFVTPHSVVDVLADV